MKKYLRFGEIPPNEKSINFIKLSLNDNSDFSYFLSLGLISEAYACIPADCFEMGVSVFEIDKNNNPVLENEALKKDYNLRVNRGEVAFYVEGRRVGTGHSGEPLIIDIKIINCCA